jgi:hypothetical protein
MSGAIVLSSNSDCQNCEVIHKSGVYLLYSYSGSSTSIEIIPHCYRQNLDSPHQIRLIPQSSIAADLLPPRKYEPGIRR